MKRSTKVFLGAMGIVTAAWGVERAMAPKLPPCPVGPDGKPIVTPQCQAPRSGSGSSSAYRSGSHFYGTSSSSPAASTGPSSTTSSGVGTRTSSGGWGAIGRAFSGGG